MGDLAAIPGIAELWGRTLGDPEVRLAMLDGSVDLSHPCFIGADIVVVEPTWLPDAVEHELRREHGTWVASVLFGQPGGPVTGLAPRCTGIVVPALRGVAADSDPLNVARAIDAAVNAGATVVVVELCFLSRSGDVDGVLKNALAAADDAGVLVVAAAGNESGDCTCFPAAAPQVLAVGAYDEDGRVYGYSNWGPEYEGHGLVAPGGKFAGATPGGGLVKHQGTSCSGPVVAGVAALLASLQRQQGRPADPHAVRDALLRTARPCTGAETDGRPARCIGGRLDVPAATRLVLGRAGGPEATGPARAAASPRTGAPAAGAPAAVVPAAVVPAAVVPAAAAPAQVVLAGEGWVPYVYALGGLGYDFGSEARRDSFKQAMAPADPHDAREMAGHLVASASEARALIWTLSLELTPIYVVEPVGAYAAQLYGLLTQLLTGEVADLEAAELIERVAVAGRLTDRNVRLFSGQAVPVVEVEQVRGLQGWTTNRLAAAVLDRVKALEKRPVGADLRQALQEFRTRVYHDLRNLGVTAADRALNSAATDAFLAADALAGRLAAGLALESIEVEKSPFCRKDSDCWDVKLRFFDPDNDDRARQVSRYTIDVSDVLPVTLGGVRNWSEGSRRPA
jgi:hypothetical protein